MRGQAASKVTRSTLSLPSTRLSFLRTGTPGSGGAVDRYTAPVGVVNSAVRRELDALVQERAGGVAHRIGRTPGNAILGYFEARNFIAAIVECWAGVKHGERKPVRPGLGSL